MHTIRPLRLSDNDQVTNICGRTGFNGGETRELIREDGIIANYFALPYLAYPESLALGVDTPKGLAGYILGVPSTDVFNQWMNRHWLPNVRNRYPTTLEPQSDFEHFLLNCIHQDCVFPDFCAGYPGHLHIDLLPSLQGQGWGRALMKRFLQQLCEQGCPGVHLAVSTENLGAIRFYQELGFDVLQEAPGAQFMGRRLDLCPYSTTEHR